MKKLITSIALLGGFMAGAQTLQHTYNGSVSISQVAPSETVYASWNAAAHKMEIYNGSHTLLKTITAAVSETTLNVIYVSRTLFDADDGFEFMAYNNDQTYIIDENGTVKFSKAKGAAAFLSPAVYNTADGAVLMLNYYTSATQRSNEIYSLAGKLYSGKKEEAAGFKNGLPYPNPAIEQIIIPNQEKNSVFEVYNTEGAKVHTETITGDFIYNTGLLPAGIYYYHIGGVRAGSFVKQ